MEKTREEIVEEAAKRKRDILALLKCPEFNGYYIDHLKRRGAAHDKAALTEAGLTLEEREVRRRIGREYDILITAVQGELAMAEKTIAGK